MIEQFKTARLVEADRAVVFLVAKIEAATLTIDPSSECFLIAVALLQQRIANGHDTIYKPSVIQTPEMAIRSATSTAD